MSLLQTIQLLTANTRSFLLELGSQVDTIHQSHIAQQQTVADSVLQLSNTLTELATHAQAEISNINVTASAVREGLLAQVQEPAGYSIFLSWLWTISLWFMQVVFKGKFGRHTSYKE